MQLSISHQPSSAVFDMFVSISISAATKKCSFGSHHCFLSYLQDYLLLLKKGGHSVFFGELGLQSETMIKNSEGHGATKIKPGDNPANWMLRVMQQREKDFSDIYIQNSEYCKLKCEIAAAKANPPKELEIAYLTEFAVPPAVRQKLTNKRLRTIYWRSPAYNLSRLMVCGIIAFILGSVFVTGPTLEILTENEVSAYFSITFLSFIIIGIMSITIVLPVMLAIRNVFYKQFAAGMIDNYALGWALGVAEMGFNVLSSFTFCSIYLATSRTFPFSPLKAFEFWVRKEEKAMVISIFAINFSNQLFFISGFFHFQHRNILLFWTSLYVSSAYDGYGSNPLHCLYWTQQYIFWSHNQTAVHEGFI